MAHWGWYWGIKKKHIARTLCSKLTSIDSFKLIKGNNNTAAFTVQPFDVRAMIENDRLKITYRKHKERSYTISIDKLSCHYGGFRYYFKCPLCQKRMRFLYFAEKSVFLCRGCLNLSYQSQLLRPSRRYEYMSDKIKNHINKDGDLSKKPPRMHKNTYLMLKRRQQYYESKSHQATNREIREWFGARAEPYLDKWFDYVDESKEWKKKKVSPVI